MSTSKKCKTKKCGCTDTGLTTQPPCNQNTPSCPDPEACAEVFSGECIRYTGDTIVDSDIQYGDNFNEIAQKLTLMILNPGCTDYTNPFATIFAPLNIMSIAITQTAITIKWDAEPTAINYTFNYRVAGFGPWTSVPLIPLTPFPSQTASGLLPNTDYHFRVDTVNPPNSCFSVTILVKTNP